MVKYSTPVLLSVGLEEKKKNFNIKNLEKYRTEDLLNIIIPPKEI